MRNWTPKEIHQLIKSEKLALRGSSPVVNFELLKQAEQLDQELRMNQELYIIPYHKENNQWVRKEPMTFYEYSELIAYAPSQWACHPVNFKSLREFDTIATQQY